MTTGASHPPHVVIILALTSSLFLQRYARTIHALGGGLPPRLLDNLPRVLPSRQRLLPTNPPNERQRLLPRRPRREQERPRVRTTGGNERFAPLIYVPPIDSPLLM
jgi:hypothetical protein